MHNPSLIPFPFPINLQRTQKRYQTVSSPGCFFTDHSRRSSVADRWGGSRDQIGAKACINSPDREAPFFFTGHESVETEDRTRQMGGKGVTIWQVENVATRPLVGG
ncbi:hypothetical protein M758_3G110000 [Ceratodon purpureus]|nr:hypothetical protein M758_3G110000 [Ceratodon purpureus]